jgi:cytochrome b561
MLWKLRVTRVSTPTSYSSLQKAMHWIVALTVLAMIPLGLYMVRRYVETSFDAVTAKLYDVHKLFGFLLLWLVVLRLGVRIVRGAPALPSTVDRLQQMAAAATHAGIYVLLIVVPVLGWVGASAYNTRSVLGGFMLPAIAAHDEDFAYRVLWWHGWAAIALGALALLHIGAALFHHLVLKDEVIWRMWPSRRDP